MIGSRINARTKKKNKKLKTKTYKNFYSKMSCIKLMSAEEMEKNLAEHSGVRGLSIDEVSRLDTLIKNLYEGRKNVKVDKEGWFYNEPINLMIKHLETLGYEIQNNYYYTLIRVKPSK